MKNLKLFLLTLLALCLLSTAAMADSASPWAYDENNLVLRLVGEVSGDVVIPAEVDGYPVNAIKYNSFNSNNAVTSLTMPDSLRAIQNGAIAWMDGLTSVTLNDGLEYLGPNFTHCAALTSVTVPASVRIVDSCFGTSPNLREITFEGPCPLFLYPEACFFLMPEDYTIYVPDDQMDAYAAALADANGAAEHVRPSGRNAVVPEQVSNEDWFVFDAATGTITGYREYHAYVEIPESIGGVAVKAIGANAFARDYSVYGVTFPEGLERIEAGAFQHASNLSYVRFPTTLKTIGDDAFFNAQITLIEWREGLEEIGARAFQYDPALILTLPSTVKTIGDSAFEGSHCQELYLSGDLEHIGSRAFANTALSYLAFDFYAPIDIAADAFADNYVADLDLPWDSSFENRDAYAALLREQCPDCTVWINNPISGGVAEEPINKLTITTIQNGVWTQYHGEQKDLTVWTNYDGINVTALGEGVFKGNQTIRSFYPHHCGWFTTIGREAFADSSVAYVEMFPSITTIGDEAFRNCVNITALTLPESLTTIGAGAFRGCTGITELTLPASLTSVGEGALDGCTQLTKLTVLCDPAILPEGLLANCPALTEIYAAPDATAEQIRTLSELAGYPWYSPVPRVGEQRAEVTVMPYEPLPGDDFWYDEEYARLDRYMGYELNLYLPREIDGVALTMIGGTMMSRASYGDNFEVELPVVSLVIPENYTELPAYAFQNCDTLETVICYAPIETLPDSLFSGCTRLREVVFVNGVRSIGRYVFSGCPALETVYLGPCVESISEYAFLNADGSEAFALADCITAPALMPDVDALLEAVKCDPMPEPEPEPITTPVLAMPIGEEGAPFFGDWEGVTMELYGEVFPLSDWGMTLQFTLHEDGTADMFDGEETETYVWTVVDGAVWIDGSLLTLKEDGLLVMEDEEGSKINFTRPGQADVLPKAGEGDLTSEPITTPVPAMPIGEEGAPFFGDWEGVTMELYGEVFPLSDWGMTLQFTLHEDGTADMFDGEETETATWTVVDGAVWIDGSLLTLKEDGLLVMEDEEGSKINFVRPGTAIKQPEQAGSDPSPDTVPDGGFSQDERLERKFVCVNADMSGVTIDAGLLGGEYALTFHADGTADFVMVGQPFHGLPWTEGTADGAPAFLVDYYGTTLTAVLTEAGFDMNYFDAMLLHFVPAD